MGISVIKVTRANLMDVIMDDSMYVIKNHWMRKNRYEMIPIVDADVKDLLSDDVIVVSIVKE